MKLHNSPYISHMVCFIEDGVILTDDYDTIDDTKWPVTDYYRLWVLDAEISDEEEYSCTLYPNTHFFHLGVSGMRQSECLSYSAIK